VQRLLCFLPSRAEDAEGTPERRLVMDAAEGIATAAPGGQRTVAGGINDVGGADAGQAHGRNDIHAADGSAGPGHSGSGGLEDDVAAGIANFLEKAGRVQTVVLCTHRAVVILEALGTVAEPEVGYAAERVCAAELHAPFEAGRSHAEPGRCEGGGIAAGAAACDKDLGVKRRLWRAKNHLAGDGAGLVETVIGKSMNHVRRFRAFGRYGAVPEFVHRIRAGNRERGRAELLQRVGECVEQGGRVFQYQGAHRVARYSLGSEDEQVVEARDASVRRGNPVDTTAEEAGRAAETLLVAFPSALEGRGVNRRKIGIQSKRPAG